MFCIESFHISKFKIINEVKIDNLPNANWIFVTGENGYGKTILLQAIATALYPMDDNINKLLSSSLPGLTSIVRLNNGHTFGVYQGKDQFLQFERQSNFIFLTCYGSSRLLTSNEEVNVTDINYPSLERLFADQSIFRNIEFELIKWKLKADSKEINEDNANILRKRLSWVEELFKDLLDLKHINIDALNEEIKYFENHTENGEGVLRKELGSGHKSLIGLIGDLIIRLINSKQPSDDPKELLGIVLIDEIELHLHPKLQRELPRILSKHFPKIQFIVSTHSPIPLLGAPEKSIFLKVDRTEERGFQVTRLKKLEKDIKYLLPNSIYTSEIFSFDKIESEYSPRIDSLRTEDNYDEIQELEKAKRRLRNIDEELFPEDLFSTKK